MSRILAGDTRFHALTQAQVKRFTERGWYHSIDLPDGQVIPGLISIEALRQRVESFPIPHDLSGKRVLDVGAATGWCSFEMERRGAAVTAIDCVEYEEFHVARQLLGSNVEYRILDVEEIHRDTLGAFDFVLFFGVFYHLRHPLLGLEKILSVTTDTAFVESYVIDDVGQEIDRGRAGKLLEFYETDELGGQIDNWFGPSEQCLQAMCRAAGFARVELLHVVDSRAALTCQRRWAPIDESAYTLEPWLNSAVNNRTNDVAFHEHKDEYVCLYFKLPVQQLAKEQISVEIDGFGLSALSMTGLGRDGWQANVRRPIGLAPGAHTVRVRSSESRWSNECTIYVGETQDKISCGVPDDPQKVPCLYELENSMTESNVFLGYRHEYLSCRFRFPERQLRRDDILVVVGEHETAPYAFSHLGGDRWQTNSWLPKDLAPGKYPVGIRIRNGAIGNQMTIQLEPSTAIG